MSNVSRRILFAGALSLSLAAPVRPQDSAAGLANTSKAKVVIYRYKQYVGSALEPSVYCDENELARMDNGRYFAVMVPPGEHTFRSNDQQSGIKLNAKPGEEYYLRVELATGMWKGHGRLVFAPKEQGAFEAAKLKPLSRDKIKDSPFAVAEEGLSK